MNNSAAKVGEIFREAGTAFTKLSEMTLMLQPTDDASPGSKWSEEEVEMLRGCVNRFAVELNKISQHIKNRTMRPQKRLLEMDTGQVYDVSQSPPQQHRLVPQLIQDKCLYEWDQQPQIRNATLQNGYMREEKLQPKEIFPKKNKNDKVADLLHFNPGIVPLTPPPNIMEEDSIPQQGPSEFENDDNVCEETFCRSIVKSLCVLDPKYFKTFGDSPENTCSIGTLHAESVPNQETEIEGIDIKNRSVVTQKDNFTWSQATETWNYINKNLESEKRQILHTTPNFSLQNFSYNPIRSLQVPVETPCNIFPAGNEKNKLLDFKLKQYRPQLSTDPVPGAFTSFLTHVNGPFTPRNTQSRSLYPHDNVFENSIKQQNLDKNSSPFGPFSSLIIKQENIKKPSIAQGNDHSIFDKNRQDDLRCAEEKPKVAKNLISGPFSSIIKNNCPNFKSIIKSQTGNFWDFLDKKAPSVESTNSSFNSAQVRVQAPYENTGYFSSIRAENKEHPFSSSANFSCGTGSRARVSSRRRGLGRFANQTPADLSTPTAEPSQGQVKLSAYHQKVCKFDKIEHNVSKKRKKAITVTTPGPVTRLQKRRQLQ